MDVKTLNRLRGLTAFDQLLMDCVENNCYDHLWKCMKEMPPSTMDVEIRSLDFPLLNLPFDFNHDNSSTHLESSKNILLVYFLQAINSGLKTGKDYELMVSYLALFLKIHTETLLKCTKAREECKLVAQTLEDSWMRLESKMHSTLCIVNYLRSSF